MSSRWIIDQTIKANTVKLLEESIGKYSYDFKAKIFMILCSQRWNKRNYIEKGTQHIIKIKNFSLVLLRKACL
jgi:hypothetical protein